jgi:glycosyltransferase involved in cell wall biosynthesis
VSALVPYKRLDIAIESSRRVGVPLKIVGTGPELPRLQAIAGGAVEFLGACSDEEIRELYRGSSATLLPGVEDFGIVPVEAQASGCPVVARNAGGARETVVDGVTGVLVNDQSADAFAAGLTRVLATPFDPETIRANALRFSRQQFLARFKAAIDDALAERAPGTERPPMARGTEPPALTAWPPSVEEADGEEAAGPSWPAQEAVRQDAASVPPPVQEADRENNQ